VENSGLQFRAEGVEIMLAERMATKLKRYKSRKVILSVRPENIYDLSIIHHKDISEAQRNFINVVEPIDNEIFLYFNAGMRSLCMITTPAQSYYPDDGIEIGFDL
jgi:ABC-type sugar transport system ATPase subunit